MLGASADVVSVHDRDDDPMIPSRQAGDIRSGIDLRDRGLLRSWIGGRAGTPTIGG